MHIICPHCTTPYAIDLAILGPTGRSVRCSRCREVWLARREDGVMAPAMAAGGPEAGSADAASEWEAMAGEDDLGTETPEVDSPSIAGDWVDEDQAHEAGTDWLAAARHEADDPEPGHPRTWLRKFSDRAAALGAPGRLPLNLPTACAAMGALVLALVMWRVDVVRLLPQTAAFYKMAGLEVNLRGLQFKDVKISSETVDGRSVLVIEGAIVGEARKAVELPRLRFSVRDAQGAEIYAWNAVLQQPMLKPGERALFKSRLASPPPEGRNIDIRFFNKRDVAGGNA
ncbi:MAG: hypothetical protein QOF07_2290 [Bradyrhizobium sp.]|jgi:predicted Zn finger-like uncharacterized protein|nr:hypothetical protein [Bradyrhizobium sp.]